MIAVTIRFPDELHAALSEFAVEDRRSFNSEVVSLLEEAVAASRAQQASVGEFLAQANGPVLTSTAFAGLRAAVEHFTARTGLTPGEFLEEWRSQRLDDTPENADLSIEAAGLEAPFADPGIEVGGTTNRPLSKPGSERKPLPPPGPDPGLGTSGPGSESAPTRASEKRTFQSDFKVEKEKKRPRR